MSSLMLATGLAALCGSLAKNQLLFGACAELIS